MAFNATIDDLKPIYKRRVPKMFYDYTESGSWTEQTFRENSSDFSRLYFRQKVAVDISNRTTASKMIGENASMVEHLCCSPIVRSPHHESWVKVGMASSGFK